MPQQTEQDEAGKGQKPAICVTIPAYNEEETVSKVIEECQDVLTAAGYDHEILVINDGSTDNTKKVAENAGATVVSHHTNRGLGNTFATGLRSAIDTNADILVNIDADGQYHTEDMRELIQTVESGEADMALGVRSVFSLDHMPTGKKIGNKIGSIVTSILSGFWVKDAQSGFRAMTREIALHLNLSGDYTYVQESLIQAAHKGYAIKQVPIDFYAREDGDSRLIGSLRGYVKHAAGIVMRTYRDHQPLKTFTYISALFFLTAAVPGYQIIQQYVSTGSFDLEGRGLVVVLFALSGALTLAFGLLADMLKRQRELQEELLYELRTSEKQ